MNKNDVDKKFDFVDLFAGIGGFHQALKKLGGNCVAASEINKNCIDVYRNNFPDTQILGDISDYENSEEKKLPKFDVLVGGFPCQPFSHAGNQQGFKDADRGRLFFSIIKILEKHEECKFILLENVKNLALKEDNWMKITESLKKLNFYITEKPIILSPTHLGVPQSRERVYILGIRKDLIDPRKTSSNSIELTDLKNLSKRKKNNIKLGDANKVIENSFPMGCLLSSDEIEILNHWLEFKHGTNFESPQVPIWVDFFGYKLSNEEYENYLFESIKKENRKQIKTKCTVNQMPEWKQKFAYKNRAFYLKHKKFIDNWIKKTKILNKIKTYRKFEWNVGTSEKNYENTIIQFRQSGIRVKKNDFFPTLVAINNTPIIYDKTNKMLRKISPREAANLQSFEKNYLLPNNLNEIYKQLGNAVNVDLVKEIFEDLLYLAKPYWKDKNND